MAESEVLKELLQFLQPNVRQDIQSKAIEHVVSLTGNREGRRTLCTNPAYTKALIGLTQNTPEQECKDVYRGLINLSGEDAIVILLCKDTDFPASLLEMVIDASCPVVDAACMILANISRTTIGCKKVMDILKGSECSTDLAKLVEVFCNIGYNDKGNLHHLADVLENLTQVEDGRKFVLDKERCVIQRLLPFTQYASSDVRRRGVVAALRNCCFELDDHEWLLSDTVDILPHLLLPLAGPEELDEEDMEGLPDDLQYLDEDKTREPDPEIRKMIIEAVNKLCCRKVGRDIVKKKRTYVIMREFHKWEENESVIEACENLVSILIGDEPEPGMENFDTVEVSEEIVKETNREYHTNQESQEPDQQ